jgi:hypothetical protein
MEITGSEHERELAGSPPAPPAAPETPNDTLPAWEQVENGRYRPRRVRGSCLGRELG